MHVPLPTRLRPLSALVVLALPACYGSTTRSAQLNLASSVTTTSATLLSGTDGSLEANCRTPNSSMTTTNLQPEVSWVFANDPNDRMYLDRWCAGVGPAVSATRVVISDTAAPAVASPASSLAVVTWNIHIGAGDVPGLVRDLKAGKFTDGKPVEHFVLLLQEVYRSGKDVPSGVGAAMPRSTLHKSAGRRVDIVETANELGLELFYVPSMANGRPASAEHSEDRGNAILSSLPMQNLTAIELPFEAQRRVVAAATINGTTMEGKPWSLRVVNVHLDNKSRPSRFLQSLGAGRARQARALVEALGADSSAVIGGDLNTWSMGFMEGALSVLEQHFPLPAKHPTEATFAMAGLKLDRLMYRLPSGQKAETRRLADRRGSDHHPLIGTLEFE
jgi:endonuclease/exonuclease/phosphatase family metal-dependent hydrolase